MEKEGKVLFFKTLLLIMIVLLINFVWIVYKGGGPIGLSGFSISTIENSPSYFLQLSFFTKLFLIIQWSILFLVLFYVAARDFILVNKSEDAIDVGSYNSKNNKTDLDTLYNILQDKKSISVSKVAKIFNIDRDIAFDWCKILETGNLAELDYPGFGDPICYLKKSDISEGTKQKEESKKTDNILPNVPTVLAHKSGAPKKQFLSGFMAKIFGKKNKGEKKKVHKTKKSKRR